MEEERGRYQLGPKESKKTVGLVGNVGIFFFYLRHVKVYMSTFELNPVIGRLGSG